MLYEAELNHPQQGEMEEGVGTCMVCEKERTVSICCALCEAMICDACAWDCTHHGCTNVVCFGCFGDSTCNQCSNFVCEHCDEWINYGVNSCACGRTGCRRCVPIMLCECCQCPAGVECCGSFLPDTTEWVCSDCTDEKKVYSENLILNAHGYGDMYR